MINNRQTGRRRGRGGGSGGGNGPRQGGQQGNGSRIDNRARGNAAQLFEKYKNMAADAQRAGDRVNIEYYLQFADHYFRVLSEQRGRIEDQQPQRARRDEFDYEGDDEFGDEGEPIRAGEQGDAPRTTGDAQRMNGDGDRDGRPREFRRDRETGDGRDGNRADGNRPDTNRPDTNRNDNRERSDNRANENRSEAPRREWRDRNDRGGEQRRPVEPRNDPRPVEPEVVAGQRRAEPLAAGESLEHRAEEVLEADRPLDPPVRRRGRPRREEAEVEPAALEADRLPPALTVPANDEEAVDAPPRRRRTRRPAEETPTAAE